MPYLVRVGRIDQNKSGVGSRGYRIWRRGSVVWVWFGAIDVIGRKFYWRDAVWEEPYPCRTINKAKKKATQLLLKQLNPKTVSGQYQRLPPGHRIHLNKPRQPR